MKKVNGKVNGKVKIYSKLAILQTVGRYSRLHFHSARLSLVGLVFVFCFFW
jgi:hypothetical protein